MGNEERVEFLTNVGNCGLVPRQTVTGGRVLDDSSIRGDLEKKGTDAL